VFFYGSTQSTLDALVVRAKETFRGLIISGCEAPPFRSLTSDELEATEARLNASGAGIVFVGLGCPKQEQWVARERGSVCAVMIGVGAAFDFHAGSVRRAPTWMRDSGLEWLYRVGSEPRRLWKRYLVTNTQFILFAALQLLGRTWRGRE
jgi:N-acetylglucosaminyldiphosphoundecaprenol N-acetyl-beta-D-mannosaminyltransferase